jgi:deazaflavin-dependent oxidoreductase (nitroreductase family)
MGAIQPRETSRNIRPRLPLKDRLNQWLEHGLDWRLRGPGIGLYRLTGGAIARLWKVDLLLLTTHGRRTGKRRTVVLPFFRDGASLVVVAANAGLSSNPDWFHNLQANPTARIQIDNKCTDMRADVLSRDEAAAFWPRVEQRFPGYARYLRYTTRNIPIVRLTQAARSGATFMNSPPHST